MQPMTTPKLLLKSFQLCKNLNSQFYFSEKKLRYNYKLFMGSIAP